MTYITVNIMIVNFFQSTEVETEHSFIYYSQSTRLEQPSRLILSQISCHLSEAPCITTDSCFYGAIDTFVSPNSSILLFKLSSFSLVQDLEVIIMQLIITKRQTIHWLLNLEQSRLMVQVLLFIM